MVYLAIAYTLIFIVVIGYALNLYQRMQAVKHERARYESKDREA